MASKLSPNGFLTYYVIDEQGDATPYGIDLWVDLISQTNQLSGSTAQSRLTRHFYPRSHMPGDFHIEGTCGSQDEYASLAKFIRTHQLQLMNQPASQNFSRLPNNTGYRRLLTLSVPTESLWIRGFVKRFTLTRRGVFEPAPKFQFDFTVVFDQHSTDVRLSSDIRKYFQGGFDTPNVSDNAPPSSSISVPPGGFAANKPLQ